MWFWFTSGVLCVILLGETFYHEGGEEFMSEKKSPLSRISIAGFKSIKTCDVVLGATNVLIGSNGAGKSNFISAFSMLQSVLSQGLQIAVAQAGMSSLLYKGRKETEKISFEVRFDMNSYGFDLVPSDDNRLVFDREYFGYYGKWHTKSTVARGVSEAAWQKGVENQIGEYVIPILEQQSWRVYHFHDTGKSAKVKQEHNISNNRILMNDAGNLAAFLYRLRLYFPSEYREIVRTVRLIAPYFSDFVLEPQEGNSEQIVLKWQQLGCEDIFNASQLSDGTLRFICLVTLLMQPKSLRPATIIIDEPELGLHPYALVILAELIRQTKDDTQTIISTQCVDLLNEFDVEDVIVVDRGDDGSTFKRLSEEDLRYWLDDSYSKVGEND